MQKELRKAENALVACVFWGGGSLKASLLKVLQGVGLKAQPTVAFTMAEILLSLTIIGVVAAITLPSLTGNINERTWNTQRKALYARMSQAISLMPNINGYGQAGGTGSSSATVDTAAETFVTAGLSKVMKINNVCDHGHMQDCGLPANITALDGTQVEGGLPTSTFRGWTNTSGKNAAAFETANGESIAVYYNRNCRGADAISSWGSSYSDTGALYFADLVCANFLYDLNGTKGPNTIGKDMGIIAVLYATDSVVVAPMPLTRSAGSSTRNDASSLCTAQDSDSRLPNIDEAIVMAYNDKQFFKSIPGDFWSGSSVTCSMSSKGICYLSACSDDYAVGPHSSSDNLAVHCIKR